MKQLPLPFAEAPRFAPEDFCNAPSNEAARTWLAKPGSWTNLRLVLWGEPGRGKSHLLHNWAAAHGATLHHGPNLRGLPTPPATALAIDDSDGVADEQTLLHLLNAAQEAGLPAVLAARLPPARLPIALPDLASRLRASTAIEITAPEDELLSNLLSRLAAERQLILTLPVRGYLLTHLPRTAAALQEAVARLDHAALAAGGKISRPLAAAALADLTLE